MTPNLHPRDLIVLPVDGKAILHRANGPSPEPLVELPEGAYHFVACHNGPYAAAINPHPLEGSVYRVDWSSGTFKFTKWNPPENHTCSCAAVTDSGVIYAGGGTNQSDPFESMWIIRPGAHGLTTELIPLPHKVASSGMKKRIDAMVLWQKRLIVIDNFLLPLWAFFYQVQPDSSLREEAVIEIEPHSTYEHVDNAVLGDRFVAVMSQSANHGRSFQHLSVRDPATLDEVCAFEEPLEDLDDSHHTFWSSMAFSRDLLYVASLDQGLGVVNLEEKNPKLKYRTYGGKRVLAVATCRSQHGCYVNLCRQGSLPTFQWLLEK